MDNRILEFTSLSKELTLPENFASVEKKRMIYACGDAKGGVDKRNTRLTNIEAYSNIGFNVFCCVGKDPANVAYLTSKPELNVVLCIMTGHKYIDYLILERLFPNMLDLIATDDRRFYPPSETAFAILKVGGVCENVPRYFITGTIMTNGREYSEDLQWGLPNFSIEKLSNNLVTLKKIGSVFDTKAKYTNNIPNNTSHNEQIARKLQSIENVRNREHERRKANKTLRQSRERREANNVLNHPINVGKKMTGSSKAGGFRKGQTKKRRRSLI